jgi:DNA-binding IclR family transcriptional regulator
LGYGFLELAGVAWSRLDLRLAAGDALEILSRDSGESVQLALLDGTDVLFIGDLASPQGGRPGAVVGKRRAAYCTAEGKVMLAFAEERDRVLDQLTFRRLTPRTVTTRAELAAQLLVTRRNGFALEDEEQELGMRRLAAAIFDRHSQPIAAVALTVPVERCGQRRIGELAEMLSSSAKEITRNCGGRTPRGSEPVAFVPEILEIEAPSWLPEGDVPC